jgi:hypothetical protein
MRRPLAQLPAPIRRHPSFTRRCPARGDRRGGSAGCATRARRPRCPSAPGCHRGVASPSRAPRPRQPPTPRDRTPAGGPRCDVRRGGESEPAPTADPLPAPSRPRDPDVGGWSRTGSWSGRNRGVVRGTSSGEIGGHGSSWPGRGPSPWLAAVRERLARETNWQDRSLPSECRAPQFFWHPSRPLQTRRPPSQPPPHPAVGRASDRHLQAGRWWRVFQARQPTTIRVTAVSGSTKSSITQENAGSASCCWAASRR